MTMWLLVLTLYHGGITQIQFMNYDACNSAGIDWQNKVGDSGFYQCIENGGI